MKDEHMKHIIEQYHKFPLFLKATVWFTLCTILQKGIGILTTPFHTRLLPMEEYGKVSVFNSWVSIVAIIITLSSWKAIGNLCVRYNDKNKILSSSMGLSITISGCFGVIILLLSKPIAKLTGLSGMLIFCLYVYCFFQELILCWISVKNFEFSYKVVVAQSIFYSALSAFGGLAAVIFVSKTAEAKIIPGVFANLIIGIVVVISTFHKSKVFYDNEIWKYTLCFCIPLLPHYFSEIILLNSDRIMIDRMCDSSDVAVYSLAYSVGSLINIVISSLNSAFAPYQYHKIQDKDYKTLAKNTNIVIAFVGFCLCGVMLFGREIVLIFGGERYIDSISLIIPIALGVFFNYVFQLFARVQEYYEQKYTIVIASVSCAVLNIVLNYIFIEKYGYQAAAYTTFFCYFVFCILHYMFYRMACRKHVGQEIYDVKGLAFISVALIVAAVVIGFISKLVVVKYVFLLTAVAVIIWQRKRIVNFIKILREKD